MTLRIISGNFKGRTLAAPDPSTVRPTMDRVREMMFNVLAHRYIEDFSGIGFLDAFAGSGILGLETLSRGAAFGYFCDISAAQTQAISDTLKKWQINSKASAITSDLKHIPPATRPVDLIFMDPPYRDHGYMEYIGILERQGWLKHSTIIVIESEISPVLTDGWSADTRKAGRAYLSFCTR